MAIMRSDQVIDEVVSALAGARRSIVGEHFVITDEAAIEASHAAVGRGVRGTILGDAEMSKVGDLRVPSEFEVTVHGEPVGRTTSLHWRASHTWY